MVLLPDDTGQLIHDLICRHQIAEPHLGCGGIQQPRGVFETFGNRNGNGGLDLLLCFFDNIAQFHSQLTMADTRLMGRHLQCNGQKALLITRQMG